MSSLRRRVYPGLRASWGARGCRYRKRNLRTPLTEGFPFVLGPGTELSAAEKFDGQRSRERQTGRMAGSDHHKAALHFYLQDARDALLWKLQGLSEYDVRRPMTPTGTNLLGLVKHMTSAEAAYFGETFGMPFDAPALWIAGDAEPNSDMWATADETREEITGRYRQVWAHSDGTIESVSLDAVGQVPWGARLELPLHRILVHVIAETDRHAGHADIVRELIDGSAGQRSRHANTAPGDAAWWEGHRDRVERAAQEADGRATAENADGSR
jgi:uncharacterized damage-inducible protein DinB